MNHPIKLLAAPEYLRIPETPLYVASRDLTLKRHVARCELDAFTSYDFISVADYRDALDNGLIKRVGMVGPDGRIQWDGSIHAEAERLVILEARNSFRREHGLTPVTLDDCLLSADEAAATAKKAGKKAAE